MFTDHAVRSTGLSRSPREVMISKVTAVTLSCHDSNQGFFVLFFSRFTTPGPLKASELTRTNKNPTKQASKKRHDVHTTSHRRRQRRTTADATP